MERVFISTQLGALLHPIPLKVLHHIVNMQGIDFKLYPSALAKILKMGEKDVLVSVQTLLDNGLITIAKGSDGYYIAKPLKEGMKKYFDIPLSDVKNMEILPVSTKITWNKSDAKPIINDSMSTDEMKRMWLMLGAQLKEREQVDKMVKVASDSKNDDGLPW